MKFNTRQNAPVQSVTVQGLLALAFIALFMCRVSVAQVHWSIEQDGTVYIQTEELKNIVGVDFQATGPYLNVSERPDASPFSFFMAAEAERVIFAKLSSEVWVDGSLSLDLKIEPAFVNEVTAFWSSIREGPHNMPHISGSPPSMPILTASWPSGGGPITITTTERPLQLSRIEFFVDQDAPSLLNTGEDPAPFRRSHPSGARQNLSSAALSSQERVTIDGSLTLSLNVDPETRPEDLRANWYGDQFETGTVEFVAEPDAKMIQALAFIGFLLFRARRKHSHVGTSDVVELSPNQEPY